MKKQEIAITNPHIVKRKEVEFLALDIICNVCRKPITKEKHVCNISDEDEQK